MEDKEILSIKIDYSAPLELKKFTASMLAVESQYKRFLVYEEGLSGDDHQFFVHKVREGSIVIDFIKDNAQKLFEDQVLKRFLPNLKSKIDAVKNQELIEDKKDLRDIGTISNVIGDDYQAKMNFNTHFGSQVTNNFILNGIEANAIKNECLRQLAETSKEAEIVNKVTLHWKSAIGNQKSQNVDQGIIEEIDPDKKVKLVCDEGLKKQMISENENNPFNMFFLIDAEIKRIDNKPVAYVITKIHDSGLVEPEE